MKQTSLTRQTVGIVVAAQTLCAIVLCGAALLNERHTRLRALDTELQGRSDSLLGAVQDAEDPEDNVAIDPAELKLPQQDVYAVYTQGGRLLGSSAHAPVELVARAKEGFRDADLHGASYRVLQREALRIIDRAEFGGLGLRRPITIVYAAPEAHLWHEIREAIGYYLISIAVAAMLTVFFVAILLRQAFRPVSELADAASKLAPPALSFDPPPSALRLRELRLLTDVLADSAIRLRESFAREQRFVSDAAHELKTAIAVVRSSVQVLMLKPRTATEYNDGLNRVLEDTERIESLVLQMLELARLEERGCDVGPFLDLHLAAHAVATQLEPVADENGVRIKVEQSAAAIVRLRPESAETLLSNVLLNAIQHSKPASAICISVKKDDQNRVLLKVADEGSGISREALPHIFERFYREDKSRSRGTGGTGLGLAICKSIVDSAGGTIHLESVPGAGTTVTVAFMSA